MNVDLSKVILDSNYNAFKNNNSYPGSITFPTAVPPATISVPFTATSTSFTLIEAPVYSVFFAKFTEFIDGLTGSVDLQWYAALVASDNVAYFDPAHSPALPGQLQLSLNGTVATVTASVINQTANTYHVTLVVPFVFIDYTLAN